MPISRCGKLTVEFLVNRSTGSKTLNGVDGDIRCARALLTIIGQAWSHRYLVNQRTQDRHSHELCADAHIMRMHPEKGMVLVPTGVGLDLPPRGC